ncbi:GIY-YIG nuclease family protein [Rhodobacteraceae bacterium RKSG542]|uniref:GIY-YIG nuclease family protein n=1 Tax=Pseudovibrio flavus TaxID=2529854 RepID=UPI0012BD671F|nr:GIY-YIG nuclease family protein [Pseudovibrio flavus]MTI18403.1 GIY-YIG nuclease family protein [Pseudovibrio flavus]
MPFYVYILASRRNGTLYTGVTNNLARRVFEHKGKQAVSFTAKYGVSQLVYYETYNLVMDAINREKALKRWRRSWKLDAIERMNPDWDDLYEGLNQ